MNTAVNKDSWWFSALLWLLSLTVCLFLLELGARAYWRSSSGVSMRHPERILDAFYPGLTQLREVRPTHGDGFFDVLLLGGSTLNRMSGAVELSLQEAMAQAGYRHVRIFNLGYPAHSSRDSLIKYQALKNKRFELVVIYDGFNDIRVNNAPPQAYKADYSHYGWYDVINRLTDYHGSASLALPYTMTYLASKFRQQLQADRYMGRMSRPRADWVEFGSDIRSPQSLRDNLQEILHIAKERNDPVVLMSFASHVPADYTLPAFSARNLDYALYHSELEIWGKPDNVVQTLRQHNSVIRELAARNPEARFVDQEASLSGKARYFNDACHLTVAGSVLFAANIVGAIGGPVQRPLRGYEAARMPANNWQSRAPTIAMQKPQASNW